MRIVSNESAISNGTTLGFWNPSTQFGTRFRIVNQTTKCAGGSLFLSEVLLDEAFLRGDLLPVPNYLLNDGLVILVVSNGTLVPLKRLSHANDRAPHKVLRMGLPAAAPQPILPHDRPSTPPIVPGGFESPPPAAAVHPLAPVPAPVPVPSPVPAPVPVAMPTAMLAPFVQAGMPRQLPTGMPHPGLPMHPPGQQPHPPSVHFQGLARHGSYESLCAGSGGGVLPIANATVASLSAVPPQHQMALQQPRRIQPPPPQQPHLLPPGLQRPHPALAATALQPAPAAATAPQPAAAPVPPPTVLTEPSRMLGGACGAPPGFVPLTQAFAPSFWPHAQHSGAPPTAMLYAHPFPPLKPGERPISGLGRAQTRLAPAPACGAPPPIFRGGFELPVGLPKPAERERPMEQSESSATTAVCSPVSDSSSQHAGFFALLDAASALETSRGPHEGGAPERSPKKLKLSAAEGGDESGNSSSSCPTLTADPWVELPSSVVPRTCLEERSI